MYREKITQALLARDKIIVSLHAVEQFQKRIANLPPTVVAEVIEDGVRTSHKVKLLPDGGTLRVRTCAPFPYEFRAILVYDEGFECPVVTTVLRGASSKTRRKHKRAKALRKNRSESRT
ncbi:MAG: hypothetical protein N2Z23_03800 [Pyrinomonadaceae bacterium]|nr:hypothetical protein [Pyrinomonadaceae bacterium]MDW8305428.1 hypothetical protein [Acidobacteriota bacterium]